MVRQGKGDGWRYTESELACASMGSMQRDEVISMTSQPALCQDLTRIKFWRL
jgi:hypothetical protein